MIKDFLKRIIYKERASSEAYSRYLKKKGIRIGEGTYFYAPKFINIDITRPYMIEIGKNVHITHGVTVLTHGYDWSVIRGKTYDMYGSAGKVKIGDNVFIGVNSTILKGVTIGNNVIVGAGTLVNKDIPDNSVAVGNPVKIISDLETYRIKREKERIKDAKEVVYSYRERYGINPPVEELYEFFWLFEPRMEGRMPGYSVKGFNERMRRWDIYPQMEKRYYETIASYNGYEEFLKDCK